jgi:hypothetical protein
MEGRAVEVASDGVVSGRHGGEPEAWPLGEVRAFQRGKRESGARLVPILSLEGGRVDGRGENARRSPRLQTTDCKGQFAQAGCQRIRGGIAGAAAAADPIEMEVAWTDEKCDFVVTENAAGHGIAMRLPPLTLVAGDVLLGSLDAVGYGRKITKVGTDEAAMMQIRKYGIRRKVAVLLLLCVKGFKVHPGGQLHAQDLACDGQAVARVDVQAQRLRPLRLVLLEHVQRFRPEAQPEALRLQHRLNADRWIVAAIDPS